MRLHPPQILAHTDAEKGKKQAAKQQATKQAAEKRKATQALKPAAKAGKAPKKDGADKEPGKDRPPKNPKEGMAAVARVFEVVNAPGEAERCQGCVTHP